jgi:hypothetical protein
MISGLKTTIVDMQKVFIFAAVILFWLAACKTSHKKQPKAEKIQKKTGLIKNGNLNTFSGPLLKKYQDFLTGLNISTMESSVVALKEYKFLFNAASQSTCDTAYILFDKYYKKLGDTIDELHNRDASIQYESLLADSNESPSRSISPKTAAYAERLTKNGFRIVTSEGDTYIVPDMDFEVADFKSYLSLPMQKYLMQMAKEDKQGFAEDAGLTISPNQLVDRTVWWEQFNQAYPQSMVAGDARGNYKDDLSVLLQGMDNSPVTYDGKNIDDFFLKAFQYLQKSYRASRTNKLVEPYFNDLLRSDTTAAKALLKVYRKQAIIE